ncbi:hypothetical protein I6F26_21025 [Ensifer sp. IC3342]|nr:hypothetical protein [Ensifer sp. BRP08]MCA1449062.1 hypothetical protein [Ensifer sp. IC3342]
MGKKKAKDADVRPLGLLGLLKSLLLNARTDSKTAEIEDEEVARYAEERRQSIRKGARRAPKRFRP